MTKARRLGANPDKGCTKLEELTEDQEQTKLFVWLDKRAILSFAVPNGSQRSLAHAAKMKRTGLRGGVPDLMIPIPNKTHHGLFIELKRASGGNISDRQRYWIDALTMQGYKALVCKGWLEAVKVIEEYLRDVDIKMPQRDDFC